MTTLYHYQYDRVCKKYHVFFAHPKLTTTKFIIYPYILQYGHVTIKYRRCHIELSLVQTKIHEPFEEIKEHFRGEEATICMESIR